MSNPNKVSWWFREINKRSRRILDSLAILVTPFIIALYALSAYVSIYAKEGGEILSFWVSKEFSQLILLSTALASIIGFPTLAFKWYKPKFLRYHKSALSIVEDLRKQGRISVSTENKMKLVIGSDLVSCDDRSAKEICLEDLFRVSYKLAELFASPDVEVKRQFDIEKFTNDLDTFESIEDDQTKHQLLNDLKRMLSDLPYEDWNDDIRKTIMRLTKDLQFEIKNKVLRETVLDTVWAISTKGDHKTKTIIKDLFLEEMETILNNSPIEQRATILSIMQHLRDFDPAYLTALALEAITKWTSEEFDRLHNEIRFYRLCGKDIDGLLRQLWGLRSRAAQNHDEEQLRRVDRVLEVVKQCRG